jgi:hypothetical protein
MLPFSLIAELHIICAVFHSRSAFSHHCGFPSWLRFSRIAAVLHDHCRFPSSLRLSIILVVLHYRFHLLYQFKSIHIPSNSVIGCHKPSPPERFRVHVELQQFIAFRTVVTDRR